MSYVELAKEEGGAVVAGGFVPPFAEDGGGVDGRQGDVPAWGFDADGVGDDAISGAEALPLYYDEGRDPISVLEAIQAFIGEMLSIAQEALSEEIFTDTRWNRRREDLLALLLIGDYIIWDKVRGR